MKTEDPKLAARSVAAAVACSVMFESQESKPESCRNSFYDPVAGVFHEWTRNNYNNNYLTACIFYFLLFFV